MVEQIPIFSLFVGVFLGKKPTPTKVVKMGLLFSTPLFILYQIKITLNQEALSCNMKKRNRDITGLSVLI